MSTTTDYGEPWKSYLGGIRDRDMTYIGHLPSVHITERAIACTNALAGIPDPEAALTAAREALASCQHSDICAVNLCLGACDCGKDAALSLLTPAPTKQP